MCSLILDVFVLLWIHVYFVYKPWIAIEHLSQARILLVFRMFLWQFQRLLQVTECTWGLWKLLLLPNHSAVFFLWILDIGLCLLASNLFWSSMRYLLRWWNQVASSGSSRIIFYIVLVWLIFIGDWLLCRQQTAIVLWTPSIGCTVDLLPSNIPFIALYW